DTNSGQQKSTKFVFDTATNGIGQLDHADSPDGINTSYTYDSHGRPTATTVTDTGANKSFTTTVGYDSYSRLKTTAYPDTPSAGRFTTTAGYNPYGYANGLDDTTNAASPKKLQTITGVNLDGQLTDATLGTIDPASDPTHALTVHNMYDAATGRVKELTTKQGTETLRRDIAYTYFDDGLIKTRTQKDTTSAGTRAEAYDYDAAGRLTTWDLTNNTSPKTTTTYQYDTAGNLTAVTGGPNPDETRTYGRDDNTLPHALTADSDLGHGGKETYTYDQQGRQTSSNVSGQTRRTIDGYTAFDLPTAITQNGKTTKYAYDAFGTRIKATGPEGTDYTLGLTEEHTDPAGKHTWIHNIPGIGHVLDNGTTYTTQFTTTDIQNSTTSILDDHGNPTTDPTNKTQNFFYDPYGAHTDPTGKHTTPTGDTHHGYTAQHHDTNQDLINLNGRLYDPLQKNLTTPDPITTNHPYTYVNSNPTNNTDPTGYND
ncbi:RHS repeat-associated core domain-containing protein, partial [Streptomyces sp. NPDC086783]|uniref:RHS repeat protein n=1 Tax=Streptomyces sp. NPDC086783 TaxID=3365758 RepID=UPI00380F02D5